jgi:hypothetical protein
MAATLDSPAGLEADFIALICADDDLLRAEFEEIVSAGWGPPPPPANGPGRHHGPDPAGHPVATRDRAPGDTSPGAGGDRRASQRSPPPAVAGSLSASPGTARP